MQVIPKQFKKLATAIMVCERPIYWEGQINGSGSPVKVRATWHQVHIQDGLVLFGLSHFDVQPQDEFLTGQLATHIPGFIEMFPSEWDVRVSEEDRRWAWPKLVLDDGGWFAWFRNQATQAFKDEAAALEAGSEFTAVNIGRNRQLFLNLNRKEAQ
jgi:hypothetical protein